MCFCFDGESVVTESWPDDCRERLPAASAPASLPTASRGEPNAAAGSFAVLLLRLFRCISRARHAACLFISRMVSTTLLMEATMRSCSRVLRLRGSQSADSRHSGFLTS